MDPLFRYCTEYIIRTSSLPAPMSCKRDRKICEFFSEKLLDVVINEPGAFTDPILKKPWHWVTSVHKELSQNRCRCIRKEAIEKIVIFGPLSYAVISLNETFS